MYNRKIIVFAKDDRSLKVYLRAVSSLDDVRLLSILHDDKMNDKINA